MQLSDYISGLQALLDQHGDMDLYTSIDDEGNGYNKVHYAPEVRYLPEDEEGDCRPDWLLEEDDMEEDETYVKVALL